MEEGKKPLLSLSEDFGALPVSEIPAIWMKIDEMKGQIWELRREGAQFVDFRRMGCQLRSSLIEEAEKKDLLVRTMLHRLYVYDDEMDDTMYIDFLSDEEAQAERAGDFDGVVHVINGHKETDKLMSLWKMRTDEPLSPLCAPDFALFCLMEDRGEYDGIWWNDPISLHPVKWTAPRGLIFPSRVNLWERRTVREEEVVAFDTSCSFSCPCKNK